MLTIAAPVEIIIAAGIKEITEQTRPAIAIPLPPRLPFNVTAASTTLIIAQGNET